jgi:hypothetical protein
MKLKDKFTGWLGGFLSAGAPPPVATPKDEAIATGMAGREWDFDAGINNNYQPRSGHGEIKFADLIHAAENYTLLKIIIATRLDQISAQRWKLAGPKLAVKRVGEILKKPDRRSDFDTFLRALVYEVLVTDAVTIMPRKNKLGGTYSLDLIDGSTIEPKLGEDGRIDLSPDGVAYQQILSGIPVYNFSASELIYRPMNRRVRSKYGQSPVEQVLMACKTGMARDEEIYTRMARGNMPDKFVVAPELTPEKTMLKMQEYLDGYFNNFDNKAKAKVVPHGTGIIDIERGEIKSELDDHIARTICFAFSVSPQQLIQMQNRATAESSSKQAMAEGLLPLMRWIERLWNEIIHDYIGYPEVNFTWEEVETLSALEKAQINEIEIRSGVRTANEVREKLGLKPIEEKEANDVEEDEPQEAAKGRPLGEFSRAKKVQAAAPQNRVAAAVAAALAGGIVGQITNLFGGVEADVLRQVGLAELPTDATPEQAAIAAKNIAEGLDLAGFNVLADRMRGLLESVAVSAIEATAKQYGDDIPGSVAVANMRAVEYARNRSAELVGMRRDADGNLVPNPAPNMAITDTTRKMIKGEVERAILDGYGHKQIADRLKSSGVFGAKRAETIAITELAQAYIAGNNGYYETASVKFKQWAIASDESGVCDICTTNSQDGVIPWNKPFSGGQMHPTAHPRCHCDIIPYTKMPNK